MSVIKQKGESQNGGNNKTKHTKFSKKTPIISYTWYAPVYVRMRREEMFVFPENLTLSVFLFPPFWDSPFCLTDEYMLYFHLVRIQ